MTGRRTVAPRVVWSSALVGLLLIAVLALPVSAATAVWGFTVGGADSGAQRIVLDAAGNSYVTGTFANPTDFDPGAGVEMLASNGQQDVFVASYTPLGGLRWAFRIGGTGFDVAASLNLAGASLWVTGGFSNAIDLDPGPGLRRVKSHGSLDGFVLELTVAHGTLLWSGTVGGKSEDVVNGVAVAGDGSFAIGGEMSQTADVDPTAGVHAFKSAGIGDGFVTKLNAKGKFQWARRIGGTGADNINQVAPAPSGRIEVSGTFSNTVDFDPGTPVRNKASHGSYDTFLLTLSSAGAFSRVATFGGTGTDYAQGLAVTASGQTYLAGVYQATADFDPGPTVRNRTSHGGFDGFLVKLTASGTLSWVAALGSASSDQFNDIGLDDGGNVYVTGFFQGQMDFDPSGAQFLLTPFGGMDVFDLELSSGGLFVDAWKMGGTGTELGVGIAARGAGVYTVGQLAADGDYNPGPGTLTLHHVGTSFEDDGFVVRVNH